MTTVFKLSRLPGAQGEEPRAVATPDDPRFRGDVGPGQAGPASPPGGRPGVTAGPSPAPGADPEPRPLELRHRVVATAALAAIGVAFGGLMLTRGHTAVGVMLVLGLNVLPPLVLLLVPALFEPKRRGGPRLGARQGH